MLQQFVMMTNTLLLSTNTEGELQTTFYVGNVEKIVYESGDYTIRRYVAGVGMIVQDYTKT